MNAVLRLRKDNENNFKRSNIVLQSGEVAVVATPFHGTQLKIGDGQTPFRDLAYETFGLLARGFKNNADFYETDNTTIINPNNHILFLDINTGFLYYWDEGDNEYKYVSGSIVPIATDTVAGIMKLYDTINGENVDGAVTQRAVKEAVSAVQTAAHNVIFEVANEELKADFSSLADLQILN